MSASSEVKMDDNLAELPFNVTKTLSEILNVADSWKRLLSVLSQPKYRAEDVAAFAKRPDPSEAVLRDLGNKGFAVRDLLVLLDRNKLERAQLFLRRKFYPVEIVKQPHICARTSDDAGDSGSGGSLRVKCLAKGFPYPRYQWYCDDELLPNVTSNEFVLPECSSCVRTGSYSCTVSNEIGDNDYWSSVYRRKGKLHRSSVQSDRLVVTAASVALEKEVCERCSHQLSMQRLRDMMFAHGLSALPSVADSAEATTAEVAQNADIGADAESTALFATDKLALIISNSGYQNLPPLTTPECDAQALAENLLDLGFKTVTMVDLNRAEMFWIIEQYRRMLGAGVYAVFYFVGHGFEANGQCFLLPCDSSPNEQITPDDCVSVDWLLSVTQATSPALNLILLDVCRKFPPSDLTKFAGEYGRYECVVNRNTVFGYATSTGVGAYEVKGETNGVFMKYLRRHIRSPKPITDVLNFVLRDFESDPKASEHQFPELRTNLSRARSLTDPLVYDNHTVSFEHRTMEWQHIYELPDPTRVTFDDDGGGLTVTVWYDYCARFTNMVYVFTGVSLTAHSDTPSANQPSHQHMAFLRFSLDVTVENETICEDSDEGISVRYLLRDLQNLKPESLTCVIRLCNGDYGQPIGEKSVLLSPVLVMKLKSDAE